MASPPGLPQQPKYSGIDGEDEEELNRLGRQQLLREARAKDPALLAERAENRETALRNTLQHTGLQLEDHLRHDFFTTFTVFVNSLTRMTLDLVIMVILEQQRKLLEELRLATLASPPRQLQLRLLQQPHRHQLRVLFPILGMSGGTRHHALPPSLP